MRTVTVIEGQEIYDIAIQEYGDPKAVWFLLEDNPDVLPNIDTELQDGMVLLIDESKKVLKDSIKIVLAEETTLISEVVTEGQTLFDLAIQCYGGLQGVFKLIEDNPDLLIGLNDQIPFGTQLKVDESKVVNKDILNYFKRTKKRVNGGEVSGAGGVGYWIIEKDNIVS